jgi:hypothetical protein
MLHACSKLGTVAGWLIFAVITISDICYLYISSCSLDKNFIFRGALVTAVEGEVQLNAVLVILRICCSALLKFRCLMLKRFFEYTKPVSPSRHILTVGYLFTLCNPLRPHTQNTICSNGLDQCIESLLESNMQPFI